MSKISSSMILSKCAGTASGGGDQDQYLFIAACIDLEDWRRFIDDVFSEVEAENQKANLLVTAIIKPHSVREHELIFPIEWAA